MQSSEGTTRVDVLDTDCTSRLFERVYETLHLNTFGFALYKDRARKDEIVSSKSRQLRDYGLQHGDMIYLTSVNGTVLFDQPSTSSAVVSHFVYNKTTVCIGESKTKLFVYSWRLFQLLQVTTKPLGEQSEPGPSSAEPSQSENITTKTNVPVEDEVDLELYRLPGTIQRQRDEKL